MIDNQFISQTILKVCCFPFVVYCRTLNILVSAPLAVGRFSSFHRLNKKITGRLLTNGNNHSPTSHVRDLKKSEFVMAPYLFAKEFLSERTSTSDPLSFKEPAAERKHPLRHNHQRCTDGYGDELSDESLIFHPPRLNWGREVLNKLHAAEWKQK